MRMTNLSPDMIVSGVAVGWAVVLPFLPDSFFPLLDGVIGVFVLLMVALLALPQGPLPGILTLAAVALTFVERNRRKVATKLLTEDVPNLETQLAPSPPMSPQEVHPEYEESMQEETSFYPEEQQTDGFEPVAQSINEKVALPTISTNEGTASATRFFLKQHLAKTDLE
jgi:hypothetical protein